MMMNNAKIVTVLCTLAFVTISIFSVKAQQTYNYNKMVYGYDNVGNRTARTLEITTNKIIPEGGARTDTTTSVDTTQNDLDRTLNFLLPEQEVEPRVFPNPSSDYLIIDLLYDVKAMTRIQTTIIIRDAKGAVWYQGSASNLRETIDMTSLAMGKYILTVQSDRNTYVYNIIKK